MLLTPCVTYLLGTNASLHFGHVLQLLRAHYAPVIFFICFIHLVLGAGQEPEHKSR